MNENNQISWLGLANFEQKLRGKGYTLPSIYTEIVSGKNSGPDACDEIVSYRSNLVDKELQECILMLTSKSSGSSSRVFLEPRPLHALEKNFRNKISSDSSFSRTFRKSMEDRKASEIFKKEFESEASILSKKDVKSILKFLIKNGAGEASIDTPKEYSIIRKIGGISISLSLDMGGRGSLSGRIPISFHMKSSYGNVFLSDLRNIIPGFEEYFTYVTSYIDADGVMKIQTSERSAAYGINAAVDAFRLFCENFREA
jgi:hypothetical protein